MPPTKTIDADAPVTQFMRRDFAQLRADHTRAEALDQLRATPPAGRVNYLYVADAEGRLVGVLPVRHLLFGPAETPLRELMIRDLVTVPAWATLLEACEFFIMHRLLALPVVDGERRLLGVVDVEAYTDEVLELGTVRAADDLFQLVGVHLADTSRRGPWQAFGARFPWLLCNVVGGLMASSLAGMFEAELQAVVTLALFIPVVLALAESVSMQSVSLALQALHTGTPSWRGLTGALAREAVVGVCLGLSCAVCVGVAVWMLRREVAAAGCIGGGIALGVTAAALVGVAVPSVLRLLTPRPQLAAGPIALAVADLMTLAAYFGLARWWLAAAA